MVCLGNICRSPLAEGILKNKAKHLNIIVDSAGTAGYHVGNLPDKRSIEIADRYNINLRDQRARQFNRNDFKKFDVIYAMDTNNYAHLLALTNNLEERKKIRMILNEINPNLCESVPDPYYGGENGFEEVLDLLEDSWAGLLAELIEMD